MKLTSSDFENMAKIPVKFTGDGQDINPNLEIKGIPENTQSLVLIMDDPDAPMRTWIHWLVWNISPNTNLISENSVPENAAQGKNSWGRNNYEGPMPPSGSHRYFFKIYALDNKLSLEERSSKEQLEQAMQGHVLDKAELVGVYR